MNVGTSQPFVFFNVFPMFRPWRDSIKGPLCVLQLILEDLKRNDKVDYKTIQDHLDSFQEWTTKDINEEVSNGNVRVSSIYLLSARGRDHFDVHIKCCHFYITTRCSCRNS